ncbi:MAG TPA: hypothetical protein VJ761_15540 [Ktedonobacteraceae bacterium]|nr:hypothetical protein [Ktedonobacteraceae bacterium]
MYTQPATAHTPALVIYLIDAGSSMNELCGATTKIDIVNKSLYKALQLMAQRSTRDGVILPRYKLAIFAYNSAAVVDLLDGIRNLPDLIEAGRPIIVSGDEQSEMVRGFAVVEKLLHVFQTEFQYSPPPLVCHITGTPFSQQNARDSMKIVRRIQSMRVDDGPILVENVYMAEHALSTEVQHWQQWEGVLREQQLASSEAKLLYRLSSFLPATYRENVNQYGYALQAGAANFFPGLHPDLVSLAFTASVAIPVK